MKIETNKLNFGCISSLINCLNSLEEVIIVGSCYGHGKEPFRIWFTCKSFISLAILIESVDKEFLLKAVNSNDYPQYTFVLESAFPLTSERMEKEVDSLITRVNQGFNQMQSNSEEARKRKFNVGDRAILKRDTAFSIESGGTSLVKSGSEVEITAISADWNVYTIKFENSTAMVWDENLDTIDINFKFRIGDKVIIKNNCLFETYEVINLHEVNGEPKYTIKCKNTMCYVNEDEIVFFGGAGQIDNSSYWHKTKINENLYDLPENKSGGRYNVVLGTLPDEVLYGSFYGDYWNIEGHSYIISDVIAWRELPKPPKFD